MQSISRWKAVREMTCVEIMDTEGIAVNLKVIANAVANLIVKRVAGSFWLAVAMFRKNERKRSVHACKTYLVGGFYCLTAWKKLLMIKEAIESGF